MSKLTSKTLLTSRVLATAIVMPIILGACTMHQPSFAPTVMRNKITVAETVERMELYVQPDGLHLSMRDRDAMGNFLSDYARTGQGQLYVNIPANADNGVGVEQAKGMIAQHMSYMGINPATMQMGQYQVQPDKPSPVVVSYRKLASVPIECQQGAALTQTGRNQPYPGFGCAQSANLAVLVDNPRQFLAPAAQGYAPSAHGVLVLGKYFKNETTGTPRPADQAVSSGSN